MNTSNILITGASGFIGSFIVDKALEKGYKVWAGIRKSSSKEFLKDEQINFIELNYVEPEKISMQLADFFSTHGNIDYVVHCAGITKSPNSEDFHNVNFGYTKNLLDGLVGSQHILKKFVFISSLSVMGKGDEDSCTPFNVSDLEDPNTVYGQSKLNAEKHLENVDSIPYIILRPTAVYGPRERDFLTLVRTVKKGIAPTIGYKEQYPSFVYVEDLAETVFLALESDVQNKKYFVSDGEVYTDQEYVKLLKDTLNVKRAINIKIPLFMLKVVASIGDLLSKIMGEGFTINGDKYKILTQRNWNCNISPTIEDLKFKPQYKLQAGLKKTIDWYSENGWL